MQLLIRSQLMAVKNRYHYFEDFKSAAQSQGKLGSLFCFPLSYDLKHVKTNNIVKPTKIALYAKNYKHPSVLASPRYKEDGIFKEICSHTDHTKMSVGTSFFFFVCY